MAKQTKKNEKIIHNSELQKEKQQKTSYRLGLQQTSNDRMYFL